MGLFGFGKKKKQDEDKKEDKKQNIEKGSQFDEALKNVDTKKLSRKEKIALGMFKRLPKKKQQSILEKAMNPQNIQREKGKILKQLNEAVKSGQMTKQEAEMIKSQLGLR